ncbi:MAG: hypothetical protein RSG52_12125 [Terrisporobacter sp.]
MNIVEIEKAIYEIQTDLLEFKYIIDTTTTLQYNIVVTCNTR